MTATYRVVRSIAWTFFKIAGRSQVIGHENIPESGPAIVACNHVSLLDPPLVGANISRESAFMARHDLWRNRLFGSIISRLNAFPVHRDTADRAALKHAVELLRRGLVLVLFPEGTRSPDARLQVAQPGLALIVQRSGAPVVPTAVVGPELMLPVGTMLPRLTRLKVVFGEPLSFAPNSSREEILDGVMGAISALLQEHRPERSPIRGDLPAAQ